MDWIGQYNYYVVFFLMMTGFYVVVARGNLVKKIVGYQGEMAQLDSAEEVDAGGAEPRPIGVGGCALWPFSFAWRATWATTWAAWWSTSTTW